MFNLDEDSNKHTDVRIQKVVECCQVESYEVYGNIMRFKVSDCNCEHYFEEFDIVQEEGMNMVDLRKVR